MFVDGLVCTGVLDGVTLVMVGVPPRIGNGNALLIVLPTFTVTCGVPVVSSDVGTIPERAVSDDVPVAVNAVPPN